VPECKGVKAEPSISFYSTNEITARLKSNGVKAYRLLIELIDAAIAIRHNL
jgi:hypothetical protein